MTSPLRVLVAGCGNMGASHARAYHKMPEFNIVGLVSRGPASRHAIGQELGGLPEFSDYYEALAATRPDVVSINTYPETHASYAKAALKAGCHVFCEKPIAETVAEAQSIVDMAHTNRRKLVVGYILRVHPAWIRFIEIARTLGKPLVMRMNLNQQSHGNMWNVHRNLMKSMSPIVDCGVHYVDVMCQITDARAVEVRGMGLRLSDEIAPEMYNYGHFQVLFEDGSLAWYEAGWGPMMSDQAFFVKDIMTPKGAVSIVPSPSGRRSDDLEMHTRADTIKVHRAELAPDGGFAQADKLIAMPNEPGHDGLCALEQDFVHRAIVDDIDLSRHMDDAVASLRICLAADESVRTGKPVRL
jgi:predicted dehydrogenase